MAIHVQMHIHVQRWTRTHLQAGVHQNFEVMAGLNYNFRGNLHARVFLTLKPWLWLLRITLLRAVQVQAGVVKSLVSFLISTHFFFYEPYLFGLSWILIFQTIFLFFLIFLDLLVLVNIHVIKIITWNLADIWHVNFPMTLLTVY